MYPASTAFWAAVLGLIYVGLSGWVVAGRVGKDTLLGDGGDDAMTRRIRAHGNFMEYVPIALIIIALLESSGASHILVTVLLVVLVVARILHPIGMFAAKNTPQQFACRGGGTIGTFTVVGVAAIALLIRTL